MRAFVGFFTTKTITDHIDRLKDETKRFLRGKWVEPQNLHITLQFLGDIDTGQSIAVLKNLQRIAETYTPFSIQYKSLGVFPDKKKPRILWIGVSRGGNILKKLAKEVTESNRRAGIRVNGKPFHPHVTVCRLKEVDRRKLGNLLTKYRDFVFGEDTVKGIALISSSLTSVGPIYSVVEEFYFRGEGR